MTKLAFVVSLIFMAASGLMAWVSRAEERPARVALRELPRVIGPWSGIDSAEFDQKTLKVLGVDDHLTRFYQSQPSREASLYIGYHDSQRTGDTMHSPMRCLPGTGWQPLATSHRRITLPDRTLEVNRYLVQKGLQRHVVLFWYQVHGRVVTSEYATKALLVADAIRLNRTDAALIRVIAPVASSEGGEQEADEAASDFVRALFPLLPRHLPS